MQIPDLINGCFEFGGSLINLMNVRAIRRDKRVSGVHWSPFAFFTAWGAWNLFYYPFLNQWLSFTGGCLIFSVNGIWLLHAFYYMKHPSNEQQ